MMRHTFSLIFLLFGFILSAQEDVLQKQNKALEKANENLEQQKIYAATLNFNNAIIKGADSTFNYLAQKKRDSLIQILRSELIAQLQGKWIWSGSGSGHIKPKKDDNSLNHYLLIKGDSLKSFEEVDNGKYLLKHKLKLVFYNDTQKQFLPSIYCQVYPDNTVWEYRMDEKGNLIIHHTGNFKENRIWSISDSVRHLYTKDE